MFIKLLILCLIPNMVFSQIQKQEQCSSTDIRKSNPKIKASKVLTKHFSVPRNQDTIGWCYAFATSDLMTVELGEPVSAFHTSAMYNDSIRSNFFSRLSKKKSKDGYFTDLYEGGQPYDALELLIAKGYVCKEKDLPFDVKLYNDTFRFIRQLEMMKLLYKEKVISHDQLCKDVDQALGLAQLKADNKLVVDALVKENVNTGILKIVQENCKDKMLQVPKMKTRKLTVDKNGKFFQEFNAVLDQGKPVEMTYETRPLLKEGDGPHSSVILGRRWKNNKCQYLVRNSWGQSCATYNKSIECDKKSGSFWLDDQVLTSTAWSLTYLTK